MIVVLKSNTPREKTQQLIDEIKSQYSGVACHCNEGTQVTIIGLVGDTSHVDMDSILAHQDIVERVTRVQEPYKMVNRKFHPQNTVITLDNGLQIGGTQVVVMAGPCSVESEEQIIEVATKVKASGAHILRGGAFKPRTSPYAFQGLRAEGVELLLKAKEATGLPIVSEVMSAAQIPLFKDVDIIQVGARNMQNFELLKELGRLKKPILLKRGLSSTIEEWLMSAEYIMAGGNERVILCERGIRTYETFTRNTLDISAVPILKHLTHLPVIVDPSHGTGITWLVEPMAKSSIVAGADGLMIEVHNNPERALSDGAQSLKPETFDGIMTSLRRYAQVEGRTL
ncbi:MAG: 3-deoxy-7-phosphoheptulonate synthase [Oscillospiraceae bacterium]|nr:3-deoxy-7-phosphoheptulonate synthase [Oscillospiraceae bacterium]